MNTIKRIAKNIGVVFFGDILTKILTLVLIIFLARYLKDVGFGKLSFAIAFTGLFIILTDFGLKRLILREIARDKKNAGKYLGTTLLIQSAFSVITFVLIYAIINLMNYPKETTLAVYIAALIIIVQSFSDTFRSVFQAFEKMEYGAITKITRVLLRVALTLPLLFLGYGVIPVLFVYLFVSTISLLINSIICFRKITLPDFRFDFESSKSLVKRAFPFAVATIFIVIYFKIDITMLSYMKGDAVVGWYSAAYRLLEALHFLPLAFTTALFPVASRYFIESKEKLIFLYENSFKYMLYLTFPIVIATVLLADKIILLIFGKGYINSINALQVLIWVIIPTFTTYVLGLVLVSINKEKIGVYGTGICAVINIILNLILIPKYSYIGASISTVVCESILFFIYFYFTSKYLYKIPLIKLGYKPLIATLLLGLFIFYFRFLNLFLIIVLGIIIYGGIMYLIGAISKEDKEILLKLIKRKQNE